MNEKLLNVMSSLVYLNTWTITIFVNLIYLLNFLFNVIDWIPQFRYWIQTSMFCHYFLCTMGHSEFEILVAIYQVNVDSKEGEP